MAVVLGIPADALLTGAIRNVDARIEVLQMGGLDPVVRARMLAEAEVLFGIPAGTPAQLRELLHSNAALRWVHATCRQSLERLQAADPSEEARERMLVTGPGGGHAAAVAEFAMSGLLDFARPSPGVGSAAERAPSELAGQTLLVVGLGAVGAELARLGKAFGMRFLAMTRTGNGRAPHVDELRPARFLGDMLPVSHAVVLALPCNDHTAGKRPQPRVVHGESWQVPAW